MIWGGHELQEVAKDRRTLGLGPLFQIWGGGGLLKKNYSESLLHHGNSALCFKNRQHSRQIYRCSIYSTNVIRYKRWHSRNTWLSHSSSLSTLLMEPQLNAHSSIFKYWYIFSYVIVSSNINHFLSNSHSFSAYFPCQLWQHLKEYSLKY